MGIGSMADYVLAPYQCRAARAAAGWSRDVLAEKSGVSVRTILSFEKPPERDITKPNRMALRQALETTGIRFTDFGIDLSNLPSHRAWMEKNHA